jgi:homogentisate 1,2-dioxygenase
MYPLKKGKTASQAHVGLPEGTYEEEHGRKGFFGKSAHLYHAHPPTGWVRFEGKLRPHCFDLNKLEPSDLTDPGGEPAAFLGNDDIRLYYFAALPTDAVLLSQRGRRRVVLSFTAEPA